MGVRWALTAHLHQCHLKMGLDNLCTIILSSMNLVFNKIHIYLKVTNLIKLEKTARESKNSPSKGTLPCCDSTTAVESALNWFRCGSWGAHQKFMLSFPSFCVPRFNLKKLVLKSENFFTFFLHMFNPQKMTVRPRSQLKPRLLKEDSAWFLLNSKIIKNWL